MTSRRLRFAERLFVSAWACVVTIVGSAILALGCAAVSLGRAIASWRDAPRSVLVVMAVAMIGLTMVFTAAGLRFLPPRTGNPTAPTVIAAAANVAYFGTWYFLIFSDLPLDWWWPLTLAFVAALAATFWEP